MRIVIVCERLAGHGGWYAYTRGLQKQLLALGHEVIVISQQGADGDHPILPSPIEAMTKPWTHIPAGGELRRVLESIEPDVIHITVEPYALIASLLPEKFLKKTVLTIHGSYGIRILERLHGRAQACRAFKRFGAFIAVSEYTKQAVITELRRKCMGKTCFHFRDRVRVVKNGIELPHVTPRYARGDRKNILLVGGVKPRKGILEAIAACADYKKRSATSFLFSIVGTCDEQSDYVRKVRAIVADLGLKEHVRLTGQVSDDELARMYADADLYLMPSGTGQNTFEGYGIAFIEANAYGVPVIGPDTSGAAEAIVEGKTGYRVDVKHPAMIAERMEWVLDERRIKPEECRAWAKQHRLEDRVADIEALYRMMRTG